MPYVNGIITAPVDTSDVATALGVNSHDIGTLCLSDKINKYALFRPTYSTVPSVTFRELPGYAPTKGGITYGDGYGWRALREPSGNYQLLYSLFYGKAWEHADPTIDTFQPISHFVGYKHKTTPKKWVTITCIAGSPIIMAFMPGAPDGYTVDVANLFPGHVMGVAIFTGAGGKNYVGKYETTETIAQIGTGFREITGPTAAEGTTYFFVPYLREKGESEVLKSGDVYAMHVCDSQTTGYTAKPYWTYFDYGYWGSNEVYVGLKFYNPCAFEILVTPKLYYCVVDNNNMTVGGWQEIDEYDPFNISAKSEGKTKDKVQVFDDYYNIRGVLLYAIANWSGSSKNGKMTSDPYLFDFSTGTEHPATGISYPALPTS